MKIISVLLFMTLLQRDDNGEQVLQKMYQRYAGKWMRTFTFDQTTENYRNDSLVKIATWYEAVVYPDKFRIDFGDKKDGNAAIFTKDSIYDFRNGMLTRRSVNDDDLTFLLGGMYFYPFDTVKAKFIAYGYDLNKSFETTLDGKPVYVIGANSAEEKTNQVWIDQEKLVVVKFTRYNDGQKEEGIFGDHKQFGSSWSETSCLFYLDGKLFQKEIYHDCKANEEIDPKIFDPHHFVTMP